MAIDVVEILKWVNSLLEKHKELELDKNGSALQAHPIICKILYKNTNYYFRIEYPSTNNTQVTSFESLPEIQRGTEVVKSFNAPLNTASIQSFERWFNIWFEKTSTKLSLLQQINEPSQDYNPHQHSITSVQSAYLDSINISDFFCIKNLTLDGLHDKKEVYFLGENGDGKTLLLQAIVLAMKRSFDYFSKTKIANALDLLDALKASAEVADLDKGALENVFVRNVFAYGVNRSQVTQAISDSFDEYGFMSLFDRQKTLVSPTDWLLKLKLDQAETGYRGITTEKAIRLLENLTDNNLKITTKGSTVLFEERGFPIGFEQLSEGYRSVLIWATDLVARLSKQQPHFKTIVYADGSEGYDFKAVVLVDEINLHLHPKWEYQIVRKLRKWFPDIQFFFTTHSPMTVLGASDDAVFYRLYKENGITRISEPYKAEDMDNWLANILITSPLFDMESARPAFFDETENADTAPDSLTSQIRQSVKTEVLRLKKERGSSYFSREEISQMIDKALQNAKK